MSRNGTKPTGVGESQSQIVVKEVNTPRRGTKPIDIGESQSQIVVKEVNTPRLGFEPRDPKGNEISSLAQYQVMRSRQVFRLLTIAFEIGRASCRERV